MDSTQHDRVFLMTFLGVLGFLVALTIFIIVVSGMITSGEPSDEVVALQNANITERIAPVGQVVTDPSMLKVAAASEEDDRSAEEIVGGLCAGCHTGGVLGAPKSGDKAAWQPRLNERGVDGLIASVVNGRGQMAAKAGDPSLSEDQIAASVKLMLKNAGLGQ
ncbi:cytochrome c5 family protein [bacterium]|nr:cytochrome c5 family protein [bacterium]